MISEDRHNTKGNEFDMLFTFRGIVGRGKVNGDGRRKEVGRKWGRAKCAWTIKRMSL